jgi:hypothetical protein
LELPLDSNCSRPTGQSSDEEEEYVTDGDDDDDDERIGGELMVVLMEEEEAVAVAGLVTAFRRIDKTSDIRSFLNC